MAKEAINSELEDDLFSGDLDNKMDFLNDKKQGNSDGIYRIDLAKAKDRKKGYKSVIRLLPNFTRAGKVGQSAIEKVSHYVNIKNEKELSGWFDSPSNFNEKCPLSSLFFTLRDSKNAILQEKAKCLNYSKKYYSYALVIEDENQPELVGKIVIFQYGITIKEKISQEKNGEITGNPVNVFSLEKGKDFVLLVKEIQTGDENYPDYKNSMFKHETSSLPIFSEEKGTFKNVPLTTDGHIDPKYKDIVKDFLLKRDHELEDISPKPLTEEQHGKINEITAYLTGKASSSYNSSKNVATADDFGTDDLVTSGTRETLSVDEEDDDFFKDL
jgi:hypothetical protein